MGTGGFMNTHDTFRTKCRLLCLSSSDPQAFWEFLQTVWTQDGSHMQIMTLQTLHNLNIASNYNGNTGCLDLCENVLSFLNDQASVHH